MSLEADYEPNINIEPDFEGWIVRYNAKSNKDGLAVSKGAFDEQKDKKIPIIVKVTYDNLVNIGACVTEYFENGIYGKCYIKEDQKVAQDILDKVERGILTHFNIRTDNDADDTVFAYGGVMVSGEIKSIDIVDLPNAFNTDTAIIISKKVSKDYEIKDDETIADYVERTTPNKPLKYEPEIDDKISDFVNKEIKRSMEEEINKKYYKKVTITKDDIKDPHDFHALPWTVDILGTRYNIKSVDRNTDDKRLEGANAYCDYYAKEIVAIKYEETEESFKDIPAFNRKTLRHEIVHAFLAESGLRRSCSWAENEEVVDWIAIQFPKMLKAFNEANAISSEDIK